jgi:hypothetical protein
MLEVEPEPEVKKVETDQSIVSVSGTALDPDLKIKKNYIRKSNN